MDARPCATNTTARRSRCTRRRTKPTRRVAPRRGACTSRVGTRPRSRSRCSPSRPACRPISSARPSWPAGWRSASCRPGARRSRPSCPSTRGCPPPSTRRWPTSPPLRIVDRAHPERAVVAAGAPWFMTLFGRDSLLTAWMTLPFDGSLAGGVLPALADLQGRDDDPASEEQPGRILHELRRHGGSGTFSLPEPLLRHRRRHPALRRAGRRGLAVAGARRGHSRRPGRRRRPRPSTG